MRVTPTRLLAALAALAVSAATLPAAPLITEFLASNQNGLTDEDGATSDWIEIHNPDLIPIDLGGHHLTDSAADPKRWTFPAATVLQPGAYLVVFASGKNRAVPGQPLHTNFSLAAGGEHLALNPPEGAPALSVWNPYPPQSSDVSYGLLAPTPGAASVHFTAPTPGAANNAADAPAGPVSITPRSTAFNPASPLSITLATPSPTATIRFTTTRSRPIDQPGFIRTFSADALTDVCTMTAHGMADRDVVRVTGPAPLLTTVNYFVVVLGPDTFKLAIEPDGPPIDLTAGGPTFTLRRDAITASASTTDNFSASSPQLFFTGDTVQVSTTGTLPEPLVAGTTYYVIIPTPSTPTTFRLSASPALTPVVDITTTGVGTLTLSRTPSPVYTAPITVSALTRLRARAFETGRPAGPVAGEIYFPLDAAGLTATSPLPLVITHTWGLSPASDVPIDGHVMVFEPQPPDNLARLTNPPQIASPCTIERRGSSTAGDPKYSIAVEMQDENGIDRNQSPFGMPAHSDWIMHAPYNFDRSFMHNDLIYRLSNDIGRYAVRTRFVEHFHNTTLVSSTINGAFSTAGDYFGVYSFMEKISRGNNRVDVENLTIADRTTPAIQGGYMFKADRLDAGESGIRPLTGQSFGNIGTMGAGANVLAWVNPRENSPDPFKRFNIEQSNWIRGHLGEAWSVLNGANANDPVNGYARYWDAGAVIDHHILNVATKNADAFRLSAFWHKPRFGKLTAGPIWDFDRSQGSTDGRDFNWGTWRGDTGDLGTDFLNYPWYREMFRDPNFWQAWIDRYHTLRQGPLATAYIHARIDEFAAQLNPGNAANTPAKRNVTRWSATPPRTAASNTTLTNNSFNGQYTGEVAWLKHWWDRRLNFFDTQFTRPAAASLPSGPVAAGATVTLTSPSQSTPGVVIYYTTDGTDPRPPAPGPLLSPSAVAYSGPVTIDQPTRLRVRVLHPNAATTPNTSSGGGVGTVPVGSRWSALNDFHYFPGAQPASAANLRITEVHYHPDSPTAAEAAAGFTNSNDFEYIRLTNIGPAPVDLTNIAFTDGVILRIAPSFANLLEPGASVVVVENAAGYASRFDATWPVLGVWTGDLNDAGETITLVDAASAIIASFTYDDVPPWPTAADEGFSLVHVDGDQADGATWQASTDPGGTGVASFATWQRRWFAAADIPAQGAEADTDGDGLGNFGEYAFGTSPRSAGPREFALATLAAGSPPGITVRRRSGASDLAWTLETSNLPAQGPWSADASPPASVVRHPDGTESVTWRPAAASGDRLFLRVRAGRP